MERERDRVDRERRGGKAGGRGRSGKRSRWRIGVAGWRREKNEERVKKRKEIVSSESVFGGGATGG